MKKFCIALGLVSALIVGCSQDKKVTNDYLVGSWECEVNNYTAGWSEGEFSEYNKVGGTNFMKVYYKKENDKYFAKKNNDEWDEGSITDEFKDGENGEIQTESNDVGKSTSKSFIEKISSDKFKMTYELELTSQNKNLSNQNKKTKDEVLCTRIK